MALIANFASTNWRLRGMTGGGGGIMAFAGSAGQIDVSDPEGEVFSGKYVMACVSVSLVDAPFAVFGSTERMPGGAIGTIWRNRLLASTLELDDLSGPFLIGTFAKGVICEIGVSVVFFNVTDWLLLAPIVSITALASCSAIGFTYGAGVSSSLGLVSWSTGGGHIAIGGKAQSAGGGAGRFGSGRK